MGHDIHRVAKGRGGINETETSVVAAIRSDAMRRSDTEKKKGERGRGNKGYK